MLQGTICLFFFCSFLLLLLVFVFTFFVLCRVAYMVVATLFLGAPSSPAVRCSPCRSGWWRHGGFGWGAAAEPWWSFRDEWTGAVASCGDAGRGLAITFDREDAASYLFLFALPSFFSSLHSLIQLMYLLRCFSC